MHRTTITHKAPKQLGNSTTVAVLCSTVQRLQRDVTSHSATSPEFTCNAQHNTHAVAKQTWQRQQAAQVRGPSSLQHDSPWHHPAESRALTRAQDLLCMRCCVLAKSVGAWQALNEYGQMDSTQQAPVAHAGRCTRQRCSHRYQKPRAAAAHACTHAHAPTHTQLLLTPPPCSS